MQVESLATAALRKYKMTGTIEPVSAAPSSKLLLQSRAPSKRPSPPPSGPLPFGVADVRAAIPAHCFERNTLISLGYVALDLVIAGTLFTMSTYISMLPWWAQILAWPVYWYAQGSVLTGVWVLAHECGHGAFSASKTVCDVVGWVLHSALLVPYFSWKYTHAAHHRNTCSLENDEVFVPPTRSEFVKEMLSETPVANAIQIVLMLTLGWPGYLLFNSSGPKKYQNVPHSHFNTASQLFTDRQRLFVALSDIGFFAMVAVLAYASWTFGFANVVFYYGIPYLIVNAHLVLITYLQHTDTYVPHYREKEFTWLRGALSTVDRSYSWILDKCFHHIADTHVVHHLFHEMPWYHAQEATAAVRKLLGPYYLYDATPIPLALWRSWSSCKFVEDEGDVVFCRNTASSVKKVE